MQLNNFSQNFFFLVFLSRWKRNKFQISMKFDLKNGKTYFESLISPLFDELHFSTIVHMNHMEHMFQDLPFYCTKKVPKNHNQFFHFHHGGGTHFLVVAQTLILNSKRCLDILSSVASSLSLPLFKTGQLVQHWVASLSFWAPLSRCWLIGC